MKYKVLGLFAAALDPSFSALGSSLGSCKSGPIPRDSEPGWPG
jgi:hypothetical protein